VGAEEAQGIHEESDAGLAGFIGSIPEQARRE